VANTDELSSTLGPVTREAVWIAGACRSERNLPNDVWMMNHHYDKPVTSRPRTLFVGAAVDLGVGIAQLDRDIPLEPENMSMTMDNGE